MDTGSLTLSEGLGVLTGSGLFIVVCIILLWIIRSFRTTNVKGGSKQALVLDIANLLIAGVLVAAISTWPFIQALVDGIRSLFASSDPANTASGLTALLIVFAAIYCRYEQGWMLFVFGLILQATSTFVPWINSILSFFAEGVIIVGNWLISVFPS